MSKYPKRPTTHNIRQYMRYDYALNEKILDELHPEYFN